MSSVTYITGSPSRTANPTASRVKRRMWSRSHSSAYWRIGLEPMKTQASIRAPVFCDTSTIGWMSTIMVRAAQFGWMRRPWSTISRQRRRTASCWRLPAPGRPTFAVSMPSRSIRCRSSTLSSTGGSVTEGLCRPSRSVSSSSITPRGHSARCGPSVRPVVDQTALAGPGHRSSVPLAPVADAFAMSLARANSRVVRNSSSAPSSSPRARRIAARW